MPVPRKCGRHLEQVGVPSSGRVRVRHNPFNFTAISGNLPAVAALMGNVVVEPSDTQVYSAQVIMEIFQEVDCPTASSTW